MRRGELREQKRPKLGHPKLRAVAEFMGLNPEDIKKGTRSRDLISEYVGRSHETIRKMTAVVDAATQEPERYGDLQLRMGARQKVDGVYRELRHRQGHGLDLDMLELLACDRRVRRLLKRIVQQAHGMDSDLRVLIGKLASQMADGLYEVRRILLGEPEDSA